MPKTLRLLLTLGLLALALFPVSSAFAQDPNAPIVRITQVDNSRFPQVTVYVSVTNAAGEPVAVDPSTIQIMENGQAMQASAVSGQGDIGTVTTLLVMDISGSMEKGDKITAAKNAAKAYIDQMRAGDQAGLISFNTEVQEVTPLTSDKNALTAGVDSLVPTGNTAMFDALLQGVDRLKDVTGRKAIILLSDGKDNRSGSNVDDVINTIGPAGLSISTIGLGDPGQTNNFGLDEPALKSLAERAGGFYGFATAPQDLLALYQQRGSALQHEMSFSYTSPATLRDGVNRSLQVSFGGDPALSTAGGYNPGGVLPEVSGRSWVLFAAILIGLLLLLSLPFLISRGSGLFGAIGKKSAATASASGGARSSGARVGAPASRSNAAKGRVRLK